MNTKFDEQKIQSVFTAFDDFEDGIYNNLVQKLYTKQVYLMSMIESSHEIFEDEESYIEDLEYFILLIDYLFSKYYGDIQPILPAFLEKEDAKHMRTIDSIMSEDDFSSSLYALFEDHPQKVLLLYLFDEIFEDDMEYDDNTLELSTQLMLLLYFVIDVYHKSLNSTYEEE